MIPQNITLETICDELGLTTFNRWQIEADREFRASPYLYKGSDARHAFEYEYIRKKYNAFLEARKASQMASREVLGVLGQQDLSYHTKEHN